MNTIKRNQIIGVVIVLAIILAIAGVLANLYDHAYLNAALLSLTLLPAIVNRRRLLERLQGRKHM